MVTRTPIQAHAPSTRSCTRLLAAPASCRRRARRRHRSIGRRSRRVHRSRLRHSRRDRTGVRARSSTSIRATTACSPSILAGATAIPVQEVVDGMRIERDHVYVIPPDTEMTVQGDVLRLVPRTPKVPHRPLDTLLLLAGAGSEERRHRRGALRQRRGRRVRTAGHSRCRRHHVRAESGKREVRGHAARGRRRGGLRAAARRNRRAAGGHRPQRRRR